MKVSYAGHETYLEVEVIRRAGGSSSSGGNRQNTVPMLNASLVDASGTIAGEWRKDGNGG